MLSSIRHVFVWFEVLRRSQQSYGHVNLTTLFPSKFDVVHILSLVTDINPS